METNLLSIVVSVLALGISAASFVRTLFLEKVVADIAFVWNQARGIAICKLIIDNPFRQSLYLVGIRFKEPARDTVSLRVANNSLDDVICNAYDEEISSEKDMAFINQRIEPKRTMEIELTFKEENTGLHITFEWSKHTPWSFLFLKPHPLVYSAKDIEVMKRAAKRGKR